METRFNYFHIMAFQKNIFDKGDPIIAIVIKPQGS